MRLVKLTNRDSGRPIYIAPGAVIYVEDVESTLAKYNTERSIYEETVKTVYIGLAGRRFPIHVQEDIATVMNVLYYKNDGGHQFGQTPFKETQT